MTTEPPAAFDGEAARRLWDERYADAGGDLWGRPPNRYVEQYLLDVPAGTALDLGCGDGRNSVWLAGRGHEVTALDISPVALEQATEQAHQLGVSISAEVADLTAWEPGSRRWDVVVHCFVHLPQPWRSQLLQTAASAVAPGGALLVVAHPVDNAERGVGGPPDRGLLPTLAEVRGDLADLDLAVCELVERAVDGADRPAIDLVAVARAAT